MSKSTFPVDIACDPNRSVIVSACAGSGKTWLLVTRMVRLLLAGAKPQEILALTFTRKAAHIIFKKLKTRREMFDVEIFYLARKYRLKVKEVPVIWVNDPDSRINLAKCVIYGSVDLFRIRINDFLGKYN